MSYRPIGDYALIGDTQSAALISSEGSLDWLCLPRFDSPALFLKLLDAGRGGYCAVRPSGRFEVSRQYVRDTCVLLTRFKTDTGTLSLIDFMPVRPGGDENRKGRDVDAFNQVIRLVQCRGEVECTLEIKVTPDYAQETPRIVRHDKGRVVFRASSGDFHVQAPTACAISDAGVITGKFAMKDHDEFALVFAWMDSAEELPEIGMKDASAKLEQTVNLWRRWSSGLQYEGEFRGTVHRSALVLKLLTYEPTGAIIAAPTTSLPEQIGGLRNWDYRYSWLRDSSLTLVALMNLGNFGEAHDYFHFITSQLHQRAENAHVLLRVDGGTDVEERDLPLAGYRDSRPVRIGNAAFHQKQLDIYGELMHCAYLYWVHADFSRHDKSFEADFWPLVKSMGDYIAQHWWDPGHGIWEMRVSKRLFTHTEGMCWVALDRAIKLAKRHGIREDLQDWIRERDNIRQAIEERGFNQEVGAYVQTFDGRALDSSILRLPMMGVIDPNSERTRGTVAAIERRLMKNGLLYRYLQDESEDGLPGTEATFTACTFWLAENYVLQGRVEEAQGLFEHTVGYANDLGLLSEEIDPNTGEQLGNFPQGFSHIGLINAAVRIAAAKGQLSDETRRILDVEAGEEERAA